MGFAPMSRRNEEAVRVGIRILVAAALAGLVALLLHGRARAAEGVPEETLASLLETTAATPEDRLLDAESQLRADRRHRWEGALRVVLGTAWNVGQGNTVRAAISGAKDLYRAWEALRVRSPIEREVLGILDAELRGGTKNESLRSLYDELLERERSSRLHDRIGEIRDALDSGNLTRARRRLKPLLERGEGNDKLESLRVALIDQESRDAVRRSELLDSAEESRVWEPQLLAALLAGDVQRVCDHPAAAGEAALVCAAALHSAGERERAIDLLGSVAEGSGPDARAAERWLSGSRIHPRRQWARAVRRYRVRQFLGWLGGSKLERNGLKLSSKAGRAWRAVLSPLNLALSFPTRAFRRRQPEGTEVRKAAALVLDWSPNEPTAREARDWLQRTRPSAAEQRRHALFEDGVLRLPHARTRYSPVFARPILLTASLLRSNVGPGLRRIAERLGEAPALLLVPDSPVDDALVGEEAPLSTPEAVTVLHELARALERGDARAFKEGTRGPVEALRRLELGIRGGRQLRVRTLASRLGDASSDDVVAILEGGTAHVERVAIRHAGDDLRAERPLYAQNFDCPDGVVCLDRPRAIGAGVYSRVDIDGDTRIGVETRIKRASLRLEMSESGPGASLRLPVAAMLGIDRWLPVEASLAVGLTGVSVEPRIQP
jgi:hypothetical protein